MWYLLVGLFFNFLGLSVMDVISNRYCPDMRPQVYVTIEQLMGMWYGVEVISHKQNEERYGVRHVDSCPIIHISEDNSPTVPPFYRGNTNTYPYGTNYGSGYQDGQYQQRDPYNQGTYNTPGSYGTNYGQGSHGTQGSQYGELPHGGIRGTTHYQGQKYGPDEYPKRYADDIKRLRLLWDENGGYVEYTLRYNTSKPGFWISSGPQNGSSLEPQYNQFAGTIQIIKAVGNHLVLTICHQLPDQQLYTALLSRVPRLTRNEISDVHDLLTQRGLETHNIKKVCSQNSANNFRANFIFLILVFAVILS